MKGTGEGFFSQEGLLRPLFKFIFITGSWSNNFIQCVGGKLKVWDLLDAVQKLFPKIKMTLVVSDELKKKKMAKLCAGWVPVLLYSSVYRALQLTFPTDVGQILLDR